MDITKCCVSSLDVLRQALTAVTRSCSLFVGLNEKPALLDDGRSNRRISHFFALRNSRIGSFDSKESKTIGPLAVCFGSLFAVWSGTHHTCFYQQFHWQPHIPMSQTKSTVTNRWCSILRMWVFLCYFIFFSSSFWFTLVSSVQTFFPEQVVLHVFFGKCHLSLKPVVLYCVVNLLCWWGCLIYP